ncbi:hypothetical protein [Mycolicibacter heraklionensis]|uniref:hypothetical protein n=1 Tax=Mycolicibacter heraklionensis TaxID=512402 RepID=UPI000A8B523F|nr:hypothetical protein [Mycolicibacter heraklionensis]
MSPTSECRDRPRRSKPSGRRFGAAGVVAALTCTLACCLPAILVALGVGASAVAGAGHAGHGTGGSSGWLAAVLDMLHRISPVLLVVSIVLVTVAFALRRRAAVLPALVAGVVLYLSVHGQGDPAVMYAGMALGYGAWIALYLWTRPPRGAGSCQESTL